MDGPGAEFHPFEASAFPPDQAPSSSCSGTIAFPRAESHPIFNQGTTTSTMDPLHALEHIVLFFSISFTLGFICAVLASQLFFLTLKFSPFCKSCAWLFPDFQAHLLAARLLPNPGRPADRRAPSRPLRPGSRSFPSMPSVVGRRQPVAPRMSSPGRKKRGWHTSANFLH